MHFKWLTSLVLKGSRIHHLKRHHNDDWELKWLKKQQVQEGCSDPPLSPWKEDINLPCIVQHREGSQYFIIIVNRVELKKKMLKKQNKWFFKIFLVKINFLVPGSRAASLSLETGNSGAKKAVWTSLEALSLTSYPKPKRLYLVGSFQSFILYLSKSCLI